MPRPPEHENFFGLRFITNVMFAGCSIPYDIIVEFSEEPSLDLLLLIAGLDTFDIVQGMFEPIKGRRRKPGRHGRKRPRFRGIPDVNEAIGRRLVPEEIGRALNKLSPYRIAFRMFNAYEGVNFAAAVAELSTNAAVAGIWGAFYMRHDTCQNLPRLSRGNPGPLTVGGVGPDWHPVNCYQRDFNNGFFDGNFNTSTGASNYGIGFRVTAFNTSSTDTKTITLRLSDPIGPTYAQSSTIEVPPRGLRDLNVSTTVPAGRQCAWLIRVEGGFVQLQDVNVLAYGEAGWLDWLL